jgi:hypothetical protein
MTSYEYISIMSAAAIFALPSFNLSYMDDNAPIHRSTLVRSWKQEHGVEGLDWPPYSPDLNPIENVWAYLKRQLNKLNNLPANLDELRSRLCQLWNDLPVTYLQNLYGSMPRRMKLCVKNRGYPINY